MSTQSLLSQVEQLPAPVQRHLADYVAFLLEKYTGGLAPQETAPLSDDPDFTEEELAELDRRFEEMETDESMSLTIEQFRLRSLERNGI